MNYEVMGTAEEQIKREAAQRAKKSTIKHMKHLLSLHVR
jgi:hypothetical protein